MAVARIVGGIDVENQLRWPGAALDPGELLRQQPVDLSHLAGGDGVLQAAERRLAGQVFLQRLARGGLQDGIAAQTGVIVAVLVAGDQAEQTLAEQLRQVVLGLGGLTVVVKQGGDLGGPAEAPVELNERKQPGI
jgi:hypothetical protein